MLRWSENAVIVSLHFSQLGPTQNAAPSTRHGDCSTAHQRRLAELPQLFQHNCQVVHRGERPAVLGAQLPLPGLQDSAQQRHGLREGAARLQHLGEPQPWIATGAEKFPRLSWGERALFWLFVVSWHTLGSKSLVGNKILGFKLFWFHLSSCCRLYWLMLLLVVNTVAYCNLRLSLLQLCGISGCKSAVTRQYSSWLNSTRLLMWSLWGDWGPHRLSAKSALSCSGPNPSAVASARHRSLGPWWCLSHGCAYHMAVRWPTMSPTAVDQHGRQKKFKRMARFAKWPRCGTASSFSQKLPGYWAAIHGPCFQRGIFNQMLLRMRPGEQVFLNLQTFVLHGAGRFKSTHSIVNRHDIE